MLPQGISSYFDTLLDILPIGFIICQPNGRVLFLNHEARQQVRLLTEEPLQIGDNIKDFVKSWSPTAQTYMDHFHTAVGGQQTRYQINIPTQHGFRYFDLRFIPIFDETQTNVTGVCFLTEDLTERNQYEVLLQQIVNLVPGIIFTKDKQDRFIFVNQTVANFVGSSIEALRGKPASEYLVTKQTPGHVMAENAQIFKDGLPLFIPEVKILNQTTNKTHIFEITQIPINIPGTDEPAILGIGTDITNWRETEENMRHALQKEQELGQLKLQFISLTSHQFRTPLATIQSIVDGLLHFGDRMTPDQQLDRLNKIQVQVREITKILNEVHILGRAQSDQLESHLRPYDMVALCADVIAYTRKELNTPLTIVSQLPDKPLTAVVDADLVHHIIYNLLSNAVKYSPPESTVTIRLAHGRVPDTDQPAAILTIQDQGIGIPADEQDKIFDSFFRGSNVQQRSGTGLGLAIVQEAITKLNGQISLHSQPNRGSTFTVIFPQAPTEQPHDPHSHY